MILFDRRKTAVHVMEAGMEDCAAIAEIHATGFARPWSDGDIAKMLAGRTTQAWIACLHGRGRENPVGFVLVRHAVDEAEVISIATAPKSRGRGVARALMGQVIRAMQGERIARLLLEVGESNQAAVSLYRSLGFRPIARRKSYYREEPAETDERQSTTARSGDALVMELDLR